MHAGYPTLKQKCFQLSFKLSIADVYNKQSREPKYLKIYVTVL